MGSGGSKTDARGQNKNKQNPKAPPFAVGQRVQARFGGDAEWFGGEVAAYHEADGSFDVRYDDDDVEAHVAPHLIRPDRAAAAPARPEEGGGGGGDDDEEGGEGGAGRGSLFGGGGRHAKKVFKLEGHPMVLWGDSGTYDGACDKTMTTAQGQGVWRRDGGDVVYRGIFSKGLPSGQGKLSLGPGENDSYYDGEWEAGKRSGHGKELVRAYVEVNKHTTRHFERCSPTADLLRVASSVSPCAHEWLGLYEGGFSKDKRQGQGTFFYDHGDSYAGEWDKGDRHGTGVYTHRDGARYEGPYLRNQRHGAGGRMAYPDGAVYTGEWAAGRPHGMGVEVRPCRAPGLGLGGGGGGDGDGAAAGGEEDGAVATATQVYHDGWWEAGLPAGSGPPPEVVAARHAAAAEAAKAAEPCSEYEGPTDADGRTHGRGTWRHYQRGKAGGLSMLYEGDFTHGELTGAGKLTFLDGSYYEGALKEGKFHGTGVLVGRDGQVEREGKWVDGEPPA